VAELLVEGERWPVYVHVIDHPAARILVDTGVTELHPEVADLDPRLAPLSEQAVDLAGIDVVVNTHLHFDRGNTPKRCSCHLSLLSSRTTARANVVRTSPDPRASSRGSLLEVRLPLLAGLSIPR
jgi:hypothetical protein